MFCVNSSLQEPNAFAEHLRSPQSCGVLLAWGVWHLSGAFRGFVERSGSRKSHHIVFAWGSACFEKKQARMVCNNAYDQEQEPHYVSEIHGVSHEAFMRMVRVAFPKSATHEDLQALCKRAMIVLFGKNRIYIRMPSASMEARVGTVDYWPPMTKPDLLTKEGIAKLKTLRGGDATPSLTHFQDRTWQLEFVCRSIIEEPKYNGAGILEDMRPFDEKPDFVPIHEDDSPGLRLCRTELANGAATSSGVASNWVDAALARRREEDQHMEGEPSSKHASASHEPAGLEAELERMMEEAPSFLHQDADPVRAEGSSE